MRQKGSCRNREVMPDDMSGKDEGQSISDPEDPSALTQDLEELMKLIRRRIHKSEAKRS